jgi:uncharacterized protein YyaL (SSP411 family)
MVLMPDGTPFFAGTYFPKTGRHGMPGFRDLLPKIAHAYRERREDIAQQNAALIDALQRTGPAPSGARELGGDAVDAAVDGLAQVFDDVHGGLGQAPKFPHPFELGFCLRRSVLGDSALAGRIAMLTLTNMAQGGIYDQLGGGFCRYSTDRFWTIPHFEKMLYDNGPLLALYSDAWACTREPLYAKVVSETAQWVMREMQAPDGGYYSSLDADSEGEEGRFYVWTRDEIQALLTAEEYAAAAPHFGLDGPANFEDRHWNLRVAQSADAVATALALDLDRCRALIASARAKLLAARERRVRPARDEKVLTSWNALMVKGMARAGRTYGRADWLDSARRAADFVRARLWRDGRLLATCKDGRAHLNAYLDDHAFLLDAWLELMQADFRSDDLAFAQAVADLLLEQFEDRQHGGFFFTSHDHEQLIHRAKTGHDGATPSGNGVAAYALQRLGHLLGEARYLDAARRALDVFHESLERSPSGHTSLVAALEEALSPPRIVVLRGAPAATAGWQAQLAQSYRPDTVVLALDRGMHGLPPALDKEDAGRVYSGVSAWVCAGVTCLPPVFELAGLERVLSRAPAP